MLTDEQLQKFSEYKHSSSKTTFEVWMIDYPAGWVERSLPGFMSANTVTLLGQIPIHIMIMVLLWHTNGHTPRLNEEVRTLLIVAGITIYWFSLIDIADGCRARRLKIGSPLGRIVDEAGDILCQAHYCLIVCIAAGFDNVYAEIFCVVVNIVFYSMELKHRVQGKLTMVTGELGPVETELVLAIIVISLGYFGNS